MPTRRGRAEGEGRLTNNPPGINLYILGHLRSFDRMLARSDRHAKRRYPAPGRRYEVQVSTRPEAERKTDKPIAPGRPASSVAEEHHYTLTTASMVSRSAELPVLGRPVPVCRLLAAAHARGPRGEHLWS